MIYIIYLPISLLMKVIGMLVAPITSLFVSKYGMLPNWLSWFQTPDSNMFGYTGDRGFYEEHLCKTDSFWGRWWVATKWQWRNTSQGFDTFVLGVEDKNLNVQTEWEKDSGDLVKYYKTAKDHNGKIKAWEFKGAFQWFNLKKRFRYRIGWKLHWDKLFPAQYVFSINPFISIEDD